MPKTPYPKRTIRWIDAASDDRWTTPGETVTVAHMVTTGYVVKEDRQSITICASIEVPKGVVGDCIAIPKKWIERARNS